MAAPVVPARDPELQWDWDCAQSLDLDGQADAYSRLQQMPRRQHVKHFQEEHRFHSKVFLDADPDVSLYALLQQPPQRPPPLDFEIQETVQRETRLGEKLLDGDARAEAHNGESSTQFWHQQLLSGTSTRRMQSRAADVEEVERRAQKLAAENAFAARRLQRREADITAVEERARQTMADLAKEKLRAKRKDAELQQRERLALAREQEMRKSLTHSLESHAALAKKEKQFEQQTKKTWEALRQQELDQLETERQAQDEILRLREEAKLERTRKLEQADEILMAKMRELEEQREANKRELAAHLGDPDAYLESSRAELAEREAEFAVQVAKQNAQLVAREQELAEWEDQLFSERQRQFSERQEILQIQEDMKRRVVLLEEHSEALVQQEDVNLAESIFIRWRGLVVDAHVQLKLNSIGFEEDSSEEAIDFPSECKMMGVTPASENLVKVPVAWVVNPNEIDGSAQKEFERERRQDYLDSLAVQQQGLIRSSFFFMWRGVILKRRRMEQNMRRVEQAVLDREGEENPRAVAWEVKGLSMRKWEFQKQKQLVEKRQDGTDQHACHTFFFMWKHILRDPRRASVQQPERFPEELDLNKSLAWSIDTSRWLVSAAEDDVADLPGPDKLDQGDRELAWEIRGSDARRKGGVRGKPFDYHDDSKEVGASRLKVVRLSDPDLDLSTVQTSVGRKTSPGSQGSRVSISKARDADSSMVRLGEVDLDTSMAQTGVGSRASHDSQDSRGSSSKARDPGMSSKSIGRTSLGSRASQGRESRVSQESSQSAKLHPSSRGSRRSGSDALASLSDLSGESTRSHGSHAASWVATF